MTENITINQQSSIRIEGSKTIYFDPFGIEQVKVIGAGADAVDFALINLCHKGAVAGTTEKDRRNRTRRGCCYRCVCSQGKEITVTFRNGAEIKA